MGPPKLALSSVNGRGTVEAEPTATIMEEQVEQPMVASHGTLIHGGHDIQEHGHTFSQPQLPQTSEEFNQVSENNYVMRGGDAKHLFLKLSLIVMMEMKVLHILQCLQR